MINLFNTLKFNKTVALNVTFKVTFNPFVTQSFFYERTCFFSTEKNNNKDNKLDITFKEWLITNKPAKVYLNSKESKKLIYNENLNKSGIYLWYNNINGKYYIGSSINLKHRFYYYFSPAYLKKNRFLIQKALMLHTHKNFSLYVIEYCEIKDLILREQYFINLLTPPYNINPIANSRLGSKHTEDTKELMRINNIGDKNPMFGKSHSVEYKTILKERMTKNNPMAGKPITEKMKKIIQEFFSRPVYVYDANSKILINKYNSRKDFIESFKISTKTVVKYLNSGKVLRKRYILSNTLLDETSVDEK